MQSIVVAASLGGAIAHESTGAVKPDKFPARYPHAAQFALQ